MSRERLERRHIKAFKGVLRHGGEHAGNMTSERFPIESSHLWSLSSAFGLERGWLEAVSWRYWRSTHNKLAKSWLLEPRWHWPGPGTEHDEARNDIHGLWGLLASHRRRLYCVMRPKSRTCSHFLRSSEPHRIDSGKTSKIRNCFSVINFGFLLFA